MKINDKDLKEVIKRFFEKARGFNLTRHLLDKKERKLMTSIDLKKGLIEHWTREITMYEGSILVDKSLILQAEKEIIELEKDVKKVVKVVKLYIDYLLF